RRPSVNAPTAETSNEKPNPARAAIMTRSVCARAVMRCGDGANGDGGGGFNGGGRGGGLRGENSRKSPGLCQSASPSRQTSASVGKPSAARRRLTSSVEIGPVCEPARV